MENALGYKINSIVSQYKQLFPDEFALFKQSLKVKQHNLRNQFASISGDEAIYRQLASFPETLYNMLLVKLTDEEFKDFQREENQKWFVKTHKEFMVPEKL